MNAKQAREQNERFPFTVAPSDYNRSFEIRCFSTLDSARGYAVANQRPFVIAASASGAIVEVG
jgi:hypothetical protein